MQNIGFDWGGGPETPVDMAGGFLNDVDMDSDNGRLGVRQRSGSVNQSPQRRKIPKMDVTNLVLAPGPVNTGPHRHEDTIKRLAEYIATEQQALKKDYCVGPAHMVDIDNITAKELGFPKAQKATMKDCAGDPREITFTVIGMLLDMDIPPVKRGRLNTRNIPFFRQHATIVGLGTEKFEKAMDKIAQVAVEVELAFEDNNVEPWTPSGGADELGDTLQTSCRLFTLSKEAPTSQIVAFDKHVDPAGVLTNTLAKGRFYCVDNEVSYMNMEGGRLVPKNPSAFRIGDIVELGFSVVAFKGSQEARAVVKLVMRSLIFLDGSQG
ncbi:hypothetical protein C8J57DRAFT_1533111 [Mycena rebaudengoi]|nr:hypothetical protein C8J57DRAFT_1533111 [Mycena rebaudengoi]